ncbi:MAG TPA: hydrogenase maturation nickel metallochaperone HypA [Anaerolineales bacterium]|nr:hydrogenase maturation nickel metallochaperone HypA [Anaerolineales bacterium]
MRELNITQTFVASVLRHIHETPAGHVTTVNIAMGEISELDPLSIRSHWNNLIQGTQAEQAEIHFRLIPAEVQCMACFQKYHPLDKKILCPYCGSVGAKILTGEECYLESIETQNE